jgi:nucleotide-binding universal stress UspA family protein
MTGSSDSVLLVPSDFSDCAPEVVRCAARLAQDLGGRLVLMHVVELPRGIEEDTPIRPRPGVREVDALAFLEEEARGTLSDYAAAVRSEFGGVPVATRVEHGPVVDKILLAAEDLHPRMIVMGTHGREGLSRLVLGSIAEQVVRAAEVPVLTLRTQHKPSCEARGCAWCSTHVSWAQSRVQTEIDG